MRNQSIPAQDVMASIDVLRPFSKIKLIALDLDGTLLASNNSPLPERVKTLARRLKHYRIDVKTTIATGRTLAGTRTLISDLGLSRHMPIILYNGAVIINNNEKIFDQQVFPEFVCQEIIGLVRRFPVKLIAYSLCLHNSRIKETAHGWSNIDKPFFDYNTMPIQWHEQGDCTFDSLPSAMVLHFRGPEVVDDIVASLSKVDNISYTHGSSYIEIGLTHANKGKALQRVAELLTLSQNQVLAMGDNNNDALMLKWAGIGVAVKKASNLAIQNSDYISNFGVINGAIEVLQIVLQAHKIFKDKKKSRQSQPSLISQENSNLRHSNFSKTDDSRFCTEAELQELAKISEYKVKYFETVKMAIDIGLLPRYFDTYGQCYYLLSDFVSIFRRANIEIFVSKLKGESHHLEQILFCGDSSITNISKETINTPVFFPAITNLISFAANLQSHSNDKFIEINYIGGTKLSTKSEFILNFAKMQLERICLAELNQIDHDSRSPHYMGSKRALCGFIIESIMPFTSSDFVVIDLMCGSGVVSGAFNKFWKTYASDSQEFCRQLAIIHGGGFTGKRAKDTIKYIIPIAEQHFANLKSRLADAVIKENEIFCSETSKKLAEEYAQFIHKFPTICNGVFSEDWDPGKEVELRRGNIFEYPYCLITSYFANTYFGVRQSIEIDSLRYAIDQIPDGCARDWALGALVSTVSSIGTTYGGHFAQPKYKNVSLLSNETLSKLFDVRARSVIHDFARRLVNIATINESNSASIETVVGPWKQAIDSLSALLVKDSVVVYLDPPYTRDEYSRYYHVLETLVRYNYPTCCGQGLTPESSDRFRSDFFKRNKHTIENLLIEILSRIIDRNWSCALSYSSSGVANLYNVIKHVSEKYKCNVRSFSTPYIHKSQGGSSPKDVLEYLIIMSPC